MQINSSFAKLIDNKDFELIFNINAKDKVYFNNINLDVPDDFNINNFNDLKKKFINYKGKPYSINKIEKILDEIDKITLIEEYKSINANVREELDGNKLNLVLILRKLKKYL